MVQLIKPSQVKIVTQQGECTVSIVLELNINLNDKTIETTKEEEIDWAVPEFSMEKIKFGK